MNTAKLATELYNKDITAANVFFYLLAQAAEKDGWQNKRQIMQGEYICKKKELADTLNLSRYKLDAALQILIDDGKISVATSPQFTIIAIIDYLNYTECNSVHKSVCESAAELSNNDISIEQAFNEQNTKGICVPIDEQMSASNKERKEEDEREKKERSKEKRERGEEEKKEIIPLTPLRDLPDGNTVSLSPSGEVLATEELPKSNIVLVYPDRTSQINGKAKLEDGKGEEEREKKVSRLERKEKEAATGKKPARSKYFLSLAEAHRLIKTRVGNKSPSLAEAMCEWATMRYAIRGKDCRLTERAIKQAFDFLNNCNYRETQAVACVQQSIDQHWLGLYELKAAPDR